jgi:hypothetical protein
MGGEEGRGQEGHVLISGHTSDGHVAFKVLHSRVKRVIQASSKAREDQCHARPCTARSGTVAIKHLVSGVPKTSAMTRHSALNVHPNTALSRARAGWGS